MSLLDMAVETGSITKRLYSAYCNYLYKVQWDKDIDFIPVEDKKYFLQLKKILSIDIQKVVDGELRVKQKEYSSLKIVVSEDRLSEIINSYTVIKKLHWKKAKKAAGLIRKLHTHLGYELAK